MDYDCLPSEILLALAESLRQRAKEIEAMVAERSAVA